MKKWVIFILIIFCIALSAIVYIMNTKNNEDGYTKIKVAEVTHSVFYAPWYVALEKGYFKDEKLKIEVQLTPGADKVTSAVLSKDADIGFAGAEASIYVYNNGEKDYIINFAALTKRDGQFIIGKCEDNENFKFEDLKNKKVLGGRKGGMPLMNFVYALKNSGIDPKNVDIDTSVEFSALAGAYIGKQGDYVNLFEPTASSLVNEGYGCVLESIGKKAGEVPYTVFGTRKSYFENNGKIIEKFTKAINKGLEFVKNNSSEVIANAIYKQFPDNSINEIQIIVERYKKADSWWDNTYIEEEAYNRLEDIMKYSDALEKSVDFDKIVSNKYNK